MNTLSILQLALIGVSTITVLTGLAVTVHFYWRRFGGPQNQLNAPLEDARLARLEQAVDAIAVEVERISEGQRFMARLQADSRDAALIPRESGRD